MNHMKKLVAVTATLSAAALVLTGCSATSAEGAGEDRVSLNVGYIDTSVNGVGVIAVAKFRECCAGLARYTTTLDL